MNVRECYEQFGGDYEGVIKRIGKEERVRLCAKMYLEGQEFKMLEDSILNNNLEDAFKNVHNLKGVAANLGFTELLEASEVMCEALRPGKAPITNEDISKMMENVKNAHDIIRESLKNLD